MKINKNIEINHLIFLENPYGYNIYNIYNIRY